MADIRNLDLEETNGALKVHSLYRNQVALTAGSANTADAPYYGFFVGTVGGSWSYIPYDGKAAISFTPNANTYYNFLASSITPDAGATGFANIGERRHNLVDAISTWTVDGDGSLAGGVFTVPSTNGSSALTSASSVLPTIGETYTYTAIISSYGSATAALITYGGQTIYNKGAAGTYTSTLTATTSAGLVVDIDVETSEDFVLDSIIITRV